MSPTVARQFEAYTRDIYGWAFRLVGRHHDALDVVQDVFLKWSDQCARQCPDKPRGWLRRVTLNRAADIVRRRKHETANPNDVAPNQHASAAETLDGAALRSDVAEALAELTDAQRGVLVAKIYDDLTFARIAGDLGVAVPTVKTHYLRAVRAVRQRLYPRWSGEESS